MEAQSWTNQMEVEDSLDESQNDKAQNATTVPIPSQGSTNALAQGNHVSCGKHQLAPHSRPGGST